ncbi:unnamed protein product, partial [Taenia asiatica]|uniref:PH domain-containing protein n=1 Tax=Taenia asiatica TaxID=60517 RepID=A0A0R3VXQ6_TAEAS
PETTHSTATQAAATQSQTRDRSAQSHAIDLGKVPLVVGGVINTGEISGAIDLQSDIKGHLGVGRRGILGGLINTGYIGGGINLKSSAEGGDKTEGAGGKAGGGGIAEGGGNGTGSAVMKIFNERTVVNFAYPKAPEKVGYLLKKRSETKRSFNRRYFVLNGNILAYSENEFSKEPLGVIFLEGHSVELVDERMFAIHFHTADYTGRSYILQAESEAEAEVRIVFSCLLFETHAPRYCTYNFACIHRRSKSSGFSFSWMQALAHCGSDFLSLSVEELEDALRELNSLTDCPDSGIREGSAQCSPAVATFSSAATVGNRNPFNTPLASPRDHRQRYQKQQQHSIVHLTGLLTLSWERMQASVREYLDGAVASAEVTEQKHQ